MKRNCIPKLFRILHDFVFQHLQSAFWHFICWFLVGCFWNLQVSDVFANPEGSGLLFWFWLKCLEAPWANTMFKVFITVSWSHLDGWLRVIGTISQVEVIGSVEIIFDSGNYTPDLWKTQLILVSSAIFHGVSPVFHGVSPLYSVIFLSTTLPRCLPANLRLV